MKVKDSYNLNRLSLIAATALEYGFSVVTRNVVDFQRCGVPCVDPWEDQTD